MTTQATEWTVQRVLQWTTEHFRKNGIESPRLEAEILLAHARGCERIRLYTDFSETMTDRERSQMRDLVKRRIDAEPVAYLTGQREFFSLPFLVSPAVLIPRPETETLVMEVLDFARSREQPRLLDVGTGSGCIAVSLAANLPSATLVAIDVCENAIGVAARNARTHNVASRVEFRPGNLFEPLAENEQFDAIVSNPPYIADREYESLAADVRLHEPSAALLAGEDGLDILGPLISRAGKHLVPGGLLAVEIDPAQTNAVSEFFDRAGFRDVKSHADANREPRVIAGRKTED